MKINPKIFKAYDIRGKEGEDLTPEFAKRLGEAYVYWLKNKSSHLMNFLLHPIEYLQHKRGGKLSVAIGFDTREMSPVLAKNLAEGVMKVGGNVLWSGLNSTPMFYFVINQAKTDGGIMVTASHNPKGDNGFKVCLAKAVPVGMGYGLEQIQELIESEKEFFSSEYGEMREKNFLIDYVNFLQKNIGKINLDNKKIVFDCANGSTGPIMEKIIPLFKLNAEKLFFATCLPAGSSENFPNHDPNPLKPGALEKLSAKIKEINAEMGIAFDADGDRAFFVKKDGSLVSADDIAIIFSQYFLNKKKGENIVLDLRMSRAVSEAIQKNGGRAILSRVGHAFVKRKMRQINAVFGAELSGHYYFRDFFFMDGAIFAALLFLKIMSESGKTIEELTRGLRNWAKSDEINFQVENAPALIEKLKEEFRDGDQKNIDGLSVEYADWWFNLRVSNTEPLVRLVVEAKNEKILNKKLIEIKKFLR
jgi:phosphomannomutase